MATRLSADEVLDFAVTVTVLAGPGEKSFTIPEIFAIKTSNVLRAAVINRLNKSTQTVVKLPEVDPACFNAYLQWLYTKTIPRKSHPTKLLSNCLMELYILGHCLQDATFMNGMIDVMIDSMNMSMGTVKFPNEDGIALLWDRVSGNCTMKAFVFTLWSFLVFEDEFDFEDWDGSMPHNFWFDLTNTAQKIVQQKRSRGDFTHCDFHEHDDRVPRDEEVCSRLVWHANETESSVDEVPAATDEDASININSEGGVRDAANAAPEDETPKEETEDERIEREIAEMEAAEKEEEERERLFQEKLRKEKEETAAREAEAAVNAEAELQRLVREAEDREIQREGG